MNLPLSVTIDTAPLDKLLRQFVDALDCRKPPMKDAMAGASMELMAYERRIFREKSGGGGGWPDLAPATKMNRLKKQAKAAGAYKNSRSGIHGTSLRAMAAGMHFPILLDTETMEGGLFVAGGSGHFQRFSKDGVSEGAEGGSHPDYKGGVGQLAAIHHYGIGVPQRQVMVGPDAAILASIGGVLTGGVQQAMAAMASQYGQTG